MNAPAGVVFLQGLLFHGTAFFCHEPVMGVAYALAMLLNVLVPHVLGTIALRKYAPGTASALLLNLPLGGWLVYRALNEGYVELHTFMVSGPLTVAGLLALIPLLFAIGRRLGLRHE